MSVAHICYLCGKMHEVAEEAGQILCSECRAWVAARQAPIDKEMEDGDEERSEA